MTIVQSYAVEVAKLSDEILISSAATPHSTNMPSYVTLSNLPISASPLEIGDVVVREVGRIAAVRAGEEHIVDGWGDKIDASSQSYLDSARVAVFLDTVDTGETAYYLCAFERGKEMAKFLGETKLVHPTSEELGTAVLNALDISAQN